MFLLSSCKNIDKMVEKGRYDEAIAYATKELAGKKNKKTKHVKALEKAFAKVTAMDMEKLNGSSSQYHSKNWDLILSLTDKIETRQNTIKPFLPLISSDGYEANFTFIKTHDIRNNTLDGAAEFRYKIASEMLQNAFSKNDKSLARNAYYEFRNAASYRDSYKDLNSLRQDALDFGQVNIKIEMEKDEFLLAPFQVNNELKKLNTYQINSTWRKYHFNSKLESFDYIAKFILEDLDVSPEKETVSRHIDNKKVKDGWEYAKTKSGKFKLDTLGKKIKVDVFKRVKAEVTEITRTKSSFAAAKLVYVDNITNVIIEEIPLNVENIFNDYALKFKGDKQALSKHNLGRLKPNLIPFPFDEEMLVDATKILKEKFIDELKTIQI